MTRKKDGVEIVKKEEASTGMMPAVEQRQAISVEFLIDKAIEKGLSVESMQQFLSMRRELKAEAAKAEFDNAMASFQGECPVIVKTKKATNKNGTTMYSYAPLDSIVEQVSALIGRHGLSYAFKVENQPNAIKVTCIVKHRDGHSEESTMETALATRTDIMSAPQQIAATVTFNKRYAFCNAFGIMTGDEDVDGKDVAPTGPPLATEAQKDEIDALAEKIGWTKADLAARFRAKYQASITTMTEVQAQGVIAGLKTVPAAPKETPKN